MYLIYLKIVILCRKFETLFIYFINVINNEKKYIGYIEFYLNFLKFFILKYFLIIIFLFV